MVRILQEVDAQPEEAPEEGAEVEEVADATNKPGTITTMKDLFKEVQK